MTLEPDLSETIAMIIGAGRSPAPSLALALAAQGASVAANDLSPALLDPLVQGAAGMRGSIRPYTADATRGMPLRSMIDEILDDWGGIDVLVNNPRIQPAAPLIDMDEYDWQRTVEMNLNGPFLTMQLVARLMREQGSGVILNIVDADPERLTARGAGAYGASQHGLRALSRAAAQELIAYNIRVHTICLGNGAAVFDKPAFHQASEAVEPGGLLAQLVLFLCSPAAAHLAGQEFAVSDHGVEPAPVEGWQNNTDRFTGSKE